MKIIHIADLHLGKTLHNYSYISIQKELLNQILDYIKNNHNDIVLIAGDIYDHHLPNVEAIQVLNHFLEELILTYHQKVLIIPGNHDSADRLDFVSSLLKTQGLYIETHIYKDIPYIELEDTRFYLLPFTKPQLLKQIDKDIPTSTYQDAFSYYFKNQHIDKNYKNILVAHQFVGHSSQISGSEVSFIGGIEVIDPSIFKDFDYVALGHLHGAQYMSRETIRYSGSLGKYSFDEAHQKKSFTIIDTNDFSIKEIELYQDKDVAVYRGTFEQFKDINFIERKNDLISIELEDTILIPHAIEELRTIYPNILRLTYPHLLSQDDIQTKSLDVIEQMDTIDLYQSFYKNVSNQELDDKALSIMKDVLEDDS